MTDEHIRTVQPTWLEVLPIKDTAPGARIQMTRRDTPWSPSTATRGSSSSRPWSTCTAMWPHIPARRSIFRPGASPACSWATQVRARPPSRHRSRIVPRVLKPSGRLQIADIRSRRPSGQGARQPEALGRVRGRRGGRGRLRGAASRRGPERRGDWPARLLRRQRQPRHAPGRSRAGRAHHRPARGEGVAGPCSVRCSRRRPLSSALLKSGVAEDRLYGCLARAAVRSRADNG